MDNGRDRDKQKKMQIHKQINRSASKHIYKQTDRIKIEEGKNKKKQ